MHAQGACMGVFAANAQGACTYTNERWQGIYGLTREQSLGDGWVAVLHPDDRASVLDQWQQTAALDVEFDMEFRLLRADGQTLCVHLCARRNLASCVGVTSYVGCVEDVTQQHATRAQLAVSEQRLRRLYESTPAMLHSIDLQGRLLTVTGQWLDTLGYTREEVIGQPMTDFLTGASRAYAQFSLSRLFAEGRCDNVAYEMVCKNGRVIDVLVSAVLERDADGQPLRSMSAVRDITGQVRAERALSNERVRLASIIEGTCASTWEWNVQTGETRFNERWASIIGYTLDDLAPISIQTWWDRAHPDDVQRSQHLLNKHFAVELPRYDCAARMQHRAGHWVWVLDRGRVLTWTPDRKPEWMFGTHTDITALKRQEDALRNC